MIPGEIIKSKSADAMLNESELKYRRLFETAQDAILILDGDTGEILDANTFIIYMLGYPLDYFIGRHLWELGFIKDKSLAQDAFLKLKTEGYIRYEDLPLETKDGQRMNVEFVSNVYLVGNKRIIQCNIRDITERKHAYEALQHLANIVEFSDDAIIGKNLDGTIVSWNTGAEKIYGYRASEVIGKPVSVLIPAGAKDELPEILRKIQNGEIISHFETKRVTKDGKIIDVSLTISPIENTQGAITGASTIARDVTESKLAERLLRESEKRYHDMFEGTNVVMFVVSPDTGRIVDVNSAASRYYGYSREEFSRIVITDINTADPKKTFRDMSYAVTSAGEVFSFRHRKKNGEIRDVEVFSTPIIRDGQRLLHSIVQDVTERKQAEESLRQNQQLLASAMDLAKMVSWEYDVATDMFTFDNHFFAFYGTTAEREGGHQISAEAYVREFVYPEDIPAVAEEIKKTLTVADPAYRSQMEHRIVRRDGTIRTIIVQLAPVFGDEGKIKKTFGANQDITERKKAEEVLRESEARYRNLFTNMLEGFAYCRMLYDDAGQPLDFVYLNVNSAFDQIIGTKTVTGKKATEVFPGIKAAFPELFDIYGRVAMTGQPTSFDLDFKPSGKWLHISAYSPAKDHFVAVFEDITARRREDEKLKKAEEKYRNIFETALDGIYQISPKGRLLTTNPAMARILGYDSVDDLITTVTDTARQLWVHQEERKDYLRQLKEHNIVQDFECEYYRKDKSQIWVSLTTHTVRGTDGKLLISEGILVDITRRRNDERDLIDRESEYRTILHTTMDGFGIISLEGRFLDVNDAFSRLTGYSREELLTLSIAGIEAKENSEEFIQHSREIIRKGEDRFETQYRRKDGSLIDVEVSVVVTDRHGGQFITFHHDITDRKRDQEALMNSRNDLEQKVLARTRELNETNESLLAEIALRNKAENEIVSSLREKEMLLKEIHHRVKNNMQVISSLLFMQARAQKDETIKEILKESQDRIKSIALVHEKLYQSTDLDRIDYTDYLRKITDHLFESYKVDPNIITLHLNAEKAILHIDKAVPCSLIINEMISNSLKHAFPGGRKGVITIDFRKGADNYIITYSDDGIGIPAGITFDRTESLGMQLIKGLTKQVNGSIELDRTAGTKYTITFPA
jgi:PAS domain S-box-containing protein